MSTISNLEKGETLDSIQLDPVHRLDLIKYAGASGDFNPIHTIDEEAKKARLPQIIAHGMWTMGNLAKIFSPYMNEGFIQDYSIRFKGMVFVGDIITLKATLTERELVEKMIFDVSAINQNEVEVLKGQIIFKLYSQ